MVELRLVDGEGGPANLAPRAGKCQGRGRGKALPAKGYGGSGAAGGALGS
jgi:hypothetical protein